MLTTDVPIDDNDDDGTRRRLNQAIDEIEGQGKTIRGIQVPASANTDGLGFVPNPDIKNSYLYGTYKAAKKERFPSHSITIVFD